MIRGHSVARLVTALLVLVVLVGCTGDLPPGPSTSSSPVPRPFTVMTTDRILTADPAAVADNGSQLLVSNVFQTLLTAEPGTGTLKLKPDAARDCIYANEVTLVCTLNPESKFHNGNRLDAAAVKFSIQRAVRLDVAGSSARLLSSLRQIETPDDLTVRFILSRPDSQFAMALAGPAASIVDPSVYNPDKVQADDEPIIGSGPFSVSALTTTELQLARFPDYLGHNPTQLASLVVRTMPDSGSIEQAMAAHTVDLVWRGLSSAALTRFNTQLGTGDRTTDGFASTRLPGARVRMIQWGSTSPDRGNAALRTAISSALQDDRTLDSLVPVGVIGHVPAFDVGGKGGLATWDRRVALTLGYDPTMPDGLDQANVIRTRLEAMGGMSVRLVEVDGAGVPATDLRLVDRKAWTWTAAAWLQPYLIQPAQRSATEVRTLDTEFRTAKTESTAALTLLARLQQTAASDAVVLPSSQGDEQLFTAQGVTIPQTSYGPGYQIGFWGITRA